MTLASTIIKEDKSVDWRMFLQIQDRGGRAYQNALDQLEEAGILRKNESDHSAIGISGYSFTRESDAECYSTLVKDRTPILLTCR